MKNKKVLSLSCPLMRDMLSSCSHQEDGGRSKIYLLYLSIKEIMLMSRCFDFIRMYSLE